MGNIKNLITMFKQGDILILKEDLICDLHKDSIGNPHAEYFGLWNHEGNWYNYKDIKPFTLTLPPLPDKDCSLQDVINYQQRPDVQEYYSKLSLWRKSIEMLKSPYTEVVLKKGSEIRFEHIYIQKSLIRLKTENGYITLSVKTEDLIKSTS